MLGFIVESLGLDAAAAGVREFVRRHVAATCGAASLLVFAAFWPPVLLIVGAVAFCAAVAFLFAQIVAHLVEG